jgi:hypothetical protein
MNIKDIDSKLYWSGDFMLSEVRDIDEMSMPDQCVGYYYIKFGDNVYYAGILENGDILEMWLEPEDPFLPVTDAE